MCGRRLQGYEILTRQLITAQTRRLAGEVWDMAQDVGDLEDEDVAPTREKGQQRLMQWSYQICTTRCFQNGSRSQTGIVYNDLHMTHRDLIYYRCRWQLMRDRLTSLGARRSAVERRDHLARLRFRPCFKTSTVQHNPAATVLDIQGRGERHSKD
jgi:hypothetical protein